MSLEIGYSIYKNDNGKLIKLKQDEINAVFGANFWGRTWACGRNDINYAWGRGYDFRSSDQCAFSPVFDKAFDGYIFDKDEWGWCEKLEYADFDEFVKKVTADFADKQEEAHQAKFNLYRQIRQLQNKIKDLRELQKSCTPNQEFAFDKWTEEICDIENDIDEKTEYIDGDDFKDCYDLNHIDAVNEMINDMRDIQKKGYIVVPFYSD